MVQRGGDLLDHHLGRRRDLGAVEGRKHDLARAPVVGAVDGQQAVAKQRLQLGEAAVAPAEVGRMRDGDVVVGLRAEREHLGHVQRAHGEHGPELLVHRQQHGQRVGGQLVGAAGAEAVLAGREVAPLGDLVPDVLRDPQERVVGRRGGDRGRHGAEHTGLASQPVFAQRGSDPRCV